MCHLFTIETERIARREGAVPHRGASYVSRIPQTLKRNFLKIRFLIPFFWEAMLERNPESMRMKAQKLLT